MSCPECEERRKRMALMAEAVRLWTLKPTGPNVTVIYTRLLNEAVARGDIE